MRNAQVEGKTNLSSSREVGHFKEAGIRQGQVRKAVADPVVLRMANDKMTSASRSQEQKNAKKTASIRGGAATVGRQNQLQRNRVGKRSLRR